MLSGPNRALIVGRSGSVTGDEEWNIVGTTDSISDFNFFRRGGGQLHPLYLYPSAQASLGFDAERRPNLSPPFLKALAEKLKLPQEGEHRLPQGITPEDIFHYAYAVFHSPTYRLRYAEFLKLDFPRLPLTSDLELFRDLAELGRQLVALHLLDTAAVPALQHPTARFPQSGDNIVDQVRYDPATQRVSINATQGFEPVSKLAWEFRIGGYQPAEKWLKDRKKRKLTLDDLEHYPRMIAALSDTSRLMEAVDARIPGWPIQ